jgi:hypothetical protein
VLDTRRRDYEPAIRQEGFHDFQLTWSPGQGMTLQIMLPIVPGKMSSGTDGALADPSLPALTAFRGTELAMPRQHLPAPLARHSWPPLQGFTRWRFQSACTILIRKMDKSYRVDYLDCG